MTVSFTLTTKTRVDTFVDSASIGDVTKYSFDCSPWAEDNEAITSAVWTIESGEASVSGQAIASNVLSAVLSLSTSGKVLVSVLLSTAGGLAKKLWLEINVRDKKVDSGDYGLTE